MDIAQIIANRSAAEVISCEISTMVRDAVAILAEKRIGALPVDGRGESCRNLLRT